MERATKVRRSGRIQRDLHNDSAVGVAVYRGHFVFIGGVDVYVFSEHAIVIAGHDVETVPAALQFEGQLGASQLVVRRRHLADRGLDHIVSQPVLEVGRDGIPHGPLQLSQEPAIEIPPVPGQTCKVAIVGGEVGELSDEERTRDPKNEAVLFDEWLVAVFCHGIPAKPITFLETRPLPLALMTITIAQIDVHQTSFEECLCVHAPSGTFLCVFQHTVRARHSGRSCKALGVVFALVGVLHDEAKHPGVCFTELSQGRIVWHYEHLRLRGKHA